MKFAIESKFFEVLPGACFGVVIAKGVDNTKEYPYIAELLAQSIAAAEARFQEHSVKEDRAILPYRDAFTTLGINPNKFMSSIEAMFTRVSKGKGLPSINPIVDLGNALSLKYTLPMGAHDIDQMDADMEVRFSREGDTFLPFGETETEELPAGEPVYAVGRKIRTRRWIWRQSELGKIGPTTRNIFFPIDGFASANKQSILQASAELAAACKEIFHVQDIQIGFLDKGQTEILL